MPQVYTPQSPVRWTWMTLTGPDGADLLHRLTTLNIRKLAPGTGALGFLLNPQGKVRSYFTLWCLGHDAYGFEFDAGLDLRWKKEFAATIDQFTFGEKIAVAETPELSSRWLFGANLPGLAENQTQLSGAIRVCHHGARDFGRDWISAWGPEAELAAWQKTLGPLDRITADEWTRLRILALRPWIDAELNESANPLEIGLRDSISENKGCYPGQEVIEKIISLGAPARRLALLKGRGPAPLPAAKVFSAGAEVGAVTSVSAENDHEFVALALVRKTHAKEGTSLEFKDQPASQGEIVRIAGFESA